MSHTVIIGAGLAGQSVARELRALRPDAAVTLVTACEGHLYPKPQLSTGLRTGKQPDQLIAKRAEAIAATGIAMLAHTSVTAIDVAGRTVTLLDPDAPDAEERLARWWRGDVPHDPTPDSTPDESAR